jgi:2-polyprenyl-3-methyl-5-hydroxy-6-metoxy-1,4-benzoquinol methylase
MDFDNFAIGYERILDENVALSGEGSTYFAKYKAQYLHRTFPILQSGKVLDFGCGVGLLSAFLEQYFPAMQVHGFDISEASLETVPGDLKRKIWFTSHIEELSRDYDLIVVANVMHHISPERRQAIVQDLANRLASDGSLVIFEHNPTNPVTRWIVDRCAFDEDAVLLPLRESAEYLRAAGLEIERSDYIVFMPHILAWLRVLEAWLYRVPLGAQYAVVARRNVSEPAYAS